LAQNDPKAILQPKNPFDPGSKIGGTQGVEGKAGITGTYDLDLTALAPSR